MAWNPLDWLTEGLGSSSADIGGMPPGMGAPPAMPPNAADLPPPPPGSQPPPLSQSPPSVAPEAGLIPPSAALAAKYAQPGGLPPPLPPPSGAVPAAPAGVPRPPDQSQRFPPSGPPPIPPPPMTSGGTPPAPPPPAIPGGGGPPTSLAPPAPGAPPAQGGMFGGGGAGPNAGLPGGTSMLGRALGLDANKEKDFFASLGAGLTAAGNAKGKSKGQALFSGAGGALEGGRKSEDDQYNERLKALSLAVTAQAAGDKSAYNAAMIKYYQDDLKASTDKVSGKGSSWNKPDYQKYLDVKRMVQGEGDVDTLNKQLQAMSPTNPKYAGLQAQRDALVTKKEGEAYAVMNFNPQTLAALNGNPPGTAKNPIPVTNQKEFDQYVQPGQAYKNPSDGKIYIRKQAGEKGDKVASEGPDQTPATRAPPPPPNPDDYNSPQSQVAEAGGE